MEETPEYAALRRFVVYGPSKPQDFFRFVRTSPYAICRSNNVQKDFKECIACGNPKKFGGRPGDGSNLWFCEKCSPLYWKSSLNNTLKKQWDKVFEENIQYARTSLSERESHT